MKELCFEIGHGSVLENPFPTTFHSTPVVWCQIAIIFVTWSYYDKIRLVFSVIGITSRTLLASNTLWFCKRGSGDGTMSQ
jgi:hypothetical protein